MKNLHYFATTLMLTLYGCSDSSSSDLVLRCNGLLNYSSGNDGLFQQSVIIKDDSVMATGEIDTFGYQIKGGDSEQTKFIKIRKKCLPKKEEQGIYFVSCLDSDVLEIENIVGDREYLEINLKTLNYSYNGFLPVIGFFYSQGICEKLQSK